MTYGRFPPVDYSWMTAKAGKVYCGNVLEIELFQLALGIAFHITRFDRIALVVQLFTPTERNLYLYEITPKVDRGGNQREAFLIDFPPQLLDLSFMSQKPTVSVWFVIVDISVSVGLDRQTDELQVVVFDRRIAVPEAEPAGTNRFDFGADKGNAALEIFNHLIVEVCLAVLLEHLDMILGMLHHSNHPTRNPM